MKLKVDSKAGLTLEVREDSPEDAARIRSVAQTVKAALRLAANTAKKANPDVLEDYRRAYADWETLLYKASESGDLKISPENGEVVEGQLPQPPIPDDALFKLLKKCQEKAYKRLEKEAETGKAPLDKDDAWVEALLTSYSEGRSMTYDEIPSYGAAQNGRIRAYSRAQYRDMLAEQIAAVALGKVADMDPTHLAPVLDAFSGGSGWVPNNIMVNSGLSAFMSGGSQARQLVGGWKQGKPKEGKERLEYHHHKQPSDPRANLSYFVEAETVTELWRVIEGEYDDFAARVAVACLAQITTKAPPPHDTYTQIDLDALKKYMQAHELRGSNHGDFHRRVVRTMRALNRLQMRSRIPSPFSDKKLITVTGPFMAVNEIEDELEQPDLFESVDEHSQTETLPSRWFVRPGMWADHWEVKGKGVWLAEFAEEWLGAAQDTSTIMARRIATLVLGAAGGTWHRQRWLSLTVEDLLIRIRFLPYPEARGQHWGDRTRKALEKALDLLKQKEELEQIAWPKGFGPKDGARGRGWVDRWLKAEVKLATPEALTHLRKAAQKTEKGADKAAEWGDKEIEAVRSKIAAEGCTQAEVAKRLGIAPAALSQVLKGARKPSKTMRPKLDQLIGGA